MAQSYGYWVERTIRHYQDSLGELIRHYLDHRLKVLQKSEPDYEDLQRARSKALESLFIDPSHDHELEQGIDIERAKRLINDHSASWRDVRDLAREVQDCNR